MAAYTYHPLESTADKAPDTNIGAFLFLRVLQVKWRADERTRTADLLQLRVIIHALHGFARGCKSPISKPVSFLCFATCCTILRSRWCQSGVKSPWITRRRLSCDWQTQIA
jgi:hypothetical protein